MLSKQRSGPLKRARTPETRRSPVIISHIVLVCSGMLLMVLLTQWFLPQDQRWFGRPPTNPPGATSGSPHTSLGKPWGELTATPLALSRPDGFFTNLPPAPEKTQWFFRGLAPGGVASLIESLALEGLAKQFLSDRSNWQQLSGGVRITPPAGVVIGISPVARQKLYSRLGQWSENAAQYEPFRIGGFTEWFGDSGLAEDKIDLVRKLLYTNDETLCFTDIAAFSQLSSPSETTLLIKSLSRVPTHLLKLHIEPDAKLQPLLDYWARGSNLRDTRLLFQSLSRADSDISVSYFLPPFARLRLYTYPQAEDPRKAQRNDSWTAMNFFNRETDDRFLDRDYALKVLASEYVRVGTKDKRFGDIVVFIAHDKALHLCVYLADDFVFTKRTGIFEPWLIMKMRELISASSPDRPFEIRIYRLKTFPPVAAVSSTERESPD